jgi:hypothetical protein
MFVRCPLSSTGWQKSCGCHTWKVYPDKKGKALGTRLS